jgi:mannonate dehydratase
MLKIAELFSHKDKTIQRFARQCGIEHVVGVFDYSKGLDVPKERLPWSYMSLVHLKTVYQDAGFKLEVIENRPPMEKTKLGLPGRDEEIDAVCDFIRSMGKLNIPVWCYEFMPGLHVLRTSRTTPARGGALATAYDHALLENAPLTEYGDVSEAHIWSALNYFLERVIPVAEEAGVKLAMHPDDPPLSPIRGIARIMSSIENYQRLLDLVPSPMNGIALCMGNFTLMTDDLPGVIRHFGAQKKIFFVHFRNVAGTPDKFVETFHDEGKTDMAACMRAYRDIGYDGVCRPDHVPVMEENGDVNRYNAYGALYAIGYLKGLLQAVYSEPVLSATHSR